MSDAHSSWGHINRGIVSGSVPLLYRIGVHSAFIPSVNMDRSGVASTNCRTQRDKANSTQFGRSLTESQIGKLSEQEFCVRCYIPNSISIQLSDGEVLSTDRISHNMV